MTAQISFDLVMESEMPFVEGSFRLPGGNWQVFVTLRRPVPNPVVRCGLKWDSGVEGVNTDVPAGYVLNKDSVKSLLGAALAVSDWEEVRGPDSMQLR